MARDLLAIPITSVASESAFSAGGRTLDDFRTSLTPKMVERLVCANDWLRGGNYVSVEEDSEQMFLLEEGNILNYQLLLMCFMNHDSYTVLTQIIYSLFILELGGLSISKEATTATES